MSNIMQQVSGDIDSMLEDKEAIYDSDSAELDTGYDDITANESDENDDSWLNDLTPYSATGTVQPDFVRDKQPEPVAAGTKSNSDDLGISFANLEHVEEDVARELKTKILDPQLEDIKARIQKAEEDKKRELEDRQKALLIKVNSKLQEKHPNIKNIINSKQFVDFVNKDSNPYATDSNFDLLARAYYMGDSDYVLAQVDEFIASRGKPKPALSVEAPKGGVSTNFVGKRSKNTITAEEYRKKRAMIRSAPKGTYPPDALEKLSSMYLKNLRKE